MEIGEREDASNDNVCEINTADKEKEDGRSINQL